MSSMLEQAIIDAKQLKETSQKLAEMAFLEKNKEKIEKAIELILEQDEAGDSAGGDIPPTDIDMSPPMGDDALGGAEQTPETKSFVNKIPPAYLGEDNSQEIEINLDSIVEKIDMLQKDLNISTDTLQKHSSAVHSSLEELPPEALAESVDEESVNEEELNEEELDEEFQLDEEMVMDLENVKAGGIHASEGELKRQYDIAAALNAQNADLMEQLKARDEEFNALEEKLASLTSNLKETREKLKKSVVLNVQLKEGMGTLTKKANEINLLNARLLYTNKVLGNVSMNERQKKQIAESISNSKTVEEAKTIYETLLKSVQTVSEKRTAPQSLTEAVNRAPSAFLPRNEVASLQDKEKDRWQRIAGIKK